jgi:uncharacterized membrane protein
MLVTCIILLLLTSTVTANTMASGESSTITVGKSGSVNYLTSNYNTDDACIQAALNAAKSGDTVTIREGDYYISRQIKELNKNLNIIGVGEVTFNLHTGSSPGLCFAGSKITTQSLSRSAQTGSSQVILSDASQVRQNDLIQIWKNVQWCPLDYPDQTTGELYMVKSVSGNTVTLNEPLLRAYNPSETVQVEIYRPIEVHIQNIRVQNVGATGVYEGMELRYCKDSSVTDCWFKDNGQASLRINTCFNVDVKNNEIYNSIHAGNGYGVSVANAAAFVNIENNHIENCRHTIMSGTGDFKALNRNVIISNNTCVGSSIADANVIDAHPMTIDYTVTGNIVYPKPGFYAFYDGTLESVFSDNHVYGGGGVKRRGSVDDGKHIIKDNYVKGGTLYQSAGNGVGDTLLITGNSNENGVYGVSLYNEDYRKVTIDGNKFNSLSDNGILLAMQPTTSDTMDVIISNNIFSNIQKNGMLLKRLDANNKMNLEINNNTIKNANLLSEYYIGIYLVDIWGANVESNYIYNDAGSMYLGIRETGSNANWNYIHNNIISGGSKNILTVGKNTICEKNFDLDEVPVNHAPIIDTVISQTVKERSSLTFTVKATDSDGDRITYSVTNLPIGAYFDSTSGVFSWVPDEGQAGTYGLTFTASDGKLTNSMKVSVTVLKADSSVPPSIIQDSRLREASPDTVFMDKPYIDIGGMDGVGAYRSLLILDLDEYNNADTIEKATLSLFWYYPAGSSRPQDTVIEVYRPASSWNSSYVSWNKKDKGIAWANAGGDWYDKNGVLQGSTPYATITIKGSALPDNRYYEMDVTDLVKEYISGKYANTGFLIKARTESNNYIAFYSSDCGNESQKPKLNVITKEPSVTVPEVAVNVILTDVKDNRLREASPENVLQSNPYIDIGGMNSVGRYRDIMLFNLSECTDSEIDNATLSLFWYYPAGSSRPQDTVIEVYRPASVWSSSYVSWNKKDKNVAWTNAGGDWYDKNGVLQGSTPYATITIKGSALPDNRYYGMDVTDLVKEYISGKYANTGFLIKARTESNNYIAFYSSDCGNESQKPKLDIEQRL